jgi:hypothetical protein
VSALAHKIEAIGIPTTVIGLVRPHLEASRVPRSVFVPFELGRPVGEPDDAAFQRRVLLQALELLERSDGPVILEEFPDDPPGWLDVPGWRPPFKLPSLGRPASADVAGWSSALADELALLSPYRAQTMARTGRTSIGISQQSSDAWPGYAAAFLGGELPSPPGGLPTPAVALRFLADDLKAFYGEAVQSEPPYPSSRQVAGWFWSETVAGALLQELRKAGMASDNNALKTVAGRFFVPAPYVRP